MFEAGFHGRRRRRTSSSSLILSSSCGSSVAKWLEPWTCNLEALSSSLALTASWICSRQSQVQIFGHTSVYFELLIADLFSLLPVGILKHIMSYLNYCFIIPEKPHRGVDNLVFIIYFLLLFVIFLINSDKLCCRAFKSSIAYSPLLFCKIRSLRSNTYYNW